MVKWTDKPWERQKGESAQAYEAFSIYLGMGAERSLSAVAQKLSKSLPLIKRWSREKEWQERIRAYDNDIEKQARKKAIADRKAMTKRHIGIAMQLQKKALEALDRLLVEDMTPKDIKEYIKMATDLERLNRTLEEENSKDNNSGQTQSADTGRHPAEGGACLRKIDFGNVSDEELAVLDEIAGKIVGESEH